MCALSEEPSPCRPPAQWGLGLEGRRFRGLEETGGPPRDQERFTSSFLTPSLALCLLKAWDPLAPSRPSMLLSLGRPRAQPAVRTQGSGCAQEQKLRLAPLPRVHPHMHRPDPGCHGAEKGK